MIWFATSVGALFYTISCISAADDIVTTEDNSGRFYDFAKQTEYAATSAPSSCVAQSTSSQTKFLMVVSTLDGKVSALDIQDNGNILWSIDADTRPLLSSSIGNLEITRDGMKTRLIPSLDGGLYQYDGESIEAIPLTAETLLSSSFKMTEDITMIGGKDIVSYGLDPVTGQLRYMCSASGCHTFGDEMVTEKEDILVVTRNTQTVRAVDSRIGQEKWNFSVGHHNLEFLPGTNIKPVSPPEDEEDVDIVTCPASGEVQEQEEDLIKIVVPEGLVVGLSSDDLDIIKWKHKFASPVANAWILRHGILKPISVFDNKHVPAMSSFEPPQNAPSPQPLLYVGKHQNQLYVQPSVAMKEKLAKIVHAENKHSAVPRVAWKPYLVSAPSRTPILNNGGLPLIGETRGELTETGLVIYNYPFDNGYYLYPEFSFAVPDEQCENNNTEEMDIFDNIRQSVWSYWKEVMVFSVFFALLVHVMLTKVAIRQGLIVVKNPCIEDESPVIKDVIEKKTGEFISRYQTDFDHIQVLGKGGFGIVFEARNKVDDCNYAVKRITLHSESSREKVMREVKALAKLEHGGIVRFFNAWLESPPPGWQEDQDKQFEDSECLSIPTPCNSVTQKGTGSLSIIMPPTPEFDIQNPFGGQKDWDNKSILRSKKAGSSQEFSVHTDSISFSREESVREESRLDGFDWNEDSLDVEFKLSDSEDSGSCSNNIPFSNDKNKKSDDSNSFSIVFEDSGCADKSSKSDSGEIVFSNDFTESNQVKLNNGTDCHIDISKSGSSLTPRPANFNGVHSFTGQNTSSSYKTKVTSPKLYLFIQMQLCRRETLKDWLISDNCKREPCVVLDIFDQIICAVEYVHNQGLMHRDLKPSNIFFSADGSIKIGDFGLVTALEDKEIELYSGDDTPYKRHTAQVGTQMYMSPEQINGKSYGHKVDIFSLGLILFELFYCFSTQMERVKILLDVKKQKFPAQFKKEYPSETKYISWLLSPNPADRPSATNILESDLLKDFSSRHNTTRLRLRTTSSSSSGSITEF